MLFKLTANERELDKAIDVMQKNKNEFIEDADEEEPEKSSFFSAYKMTGISKVPGVEDFMETLIENETKFIVFAHHNVVMDMLEACLMRQRVRYVRIDG